MIATNDPPSARLQYKSRLASIPRSIPLKRRPVMPGPYTEEELGAWAIDQREKLSVKYGNEDMLKKIQKRGENGLSKMGRRAEGSTA